MEKKSISSLFHNIFNISRIPRVKLYLHLLNVVVRFIFSPILQFWYVEVRISRSISESPLDFKITRVDCICMHVYVCFNCLIFYQFMFHCHLPKQWKWYKVCTSTDMCCNHFVPDEFWLRVCCASYQDVREVVCAGSESLAVRFYIPIKKQYTSRMDG